MKDEIHKYVIVFISSLIHTDSSIRSKETKIIDLEINSKLNDNSNDKNKEQEKDIKNSSEASQEFLSKVNEDKEIPRSFEQREHNI